MAQDLTQIVDFPAGIPDRDDYQPYLFDLFHCSNPDSCTVASHSSLGKSVNEHSYHCTVYSYSKADWDELMDHLGNVPWLEIFKHMPPMLLRR